MDAAALGKRFLESTRGQIVSLLGRGPRTVEELAQALGLTDNAIRGHLSALERDGLVRQSGVRRGGVGKPAILYELHADAAPLLSRAYAPVLSTVAEVLVEQVPPEDAERLIREVGRRLARAFGGRASGSADARVRAAAAVLVAMGGDVEVTREGNEHRIQGFGCPLSAVVSHSPEFCAAVETLITEITGEPARTCCQHGARPRCCFTIEPAA